MFIGKNVNTFHAYYCVHILRNINEMKISKGCITIMNKWQNTKDTYIYL